MSKIRVEIEIEDRKDVQVIELDAPDLDSLLKEVRALAAVEGLHVFERDKDEPLGSEVLTRKVLSLHGHRCREVEVKVRYEHRTLEHKFTPATSIFRILLWAVGKHGFNLDDTAKAKANLMLPDADQPLPKDAVIGTFVKHGDCCLTLDLTLKDFTNGC